MEKSLLAIILFCSLVMAHAQQTILQCGKLIDPKTGKVSSNVSIVVEGNKIVEVKDGFANNAGATIIDLKTKTVMPGLMDMHVHLESQTSPTK